MVRPTEPSEGSASPGSDAAEPEGGNGRGAGSIPGEEPGPGGRPGLLRSLETFVAEIAGATSTLLEIRADRARLATRRVVTGAVIRLLLVFAVVTWIVVGTTYLFRGLSGAVSALADGVPWVGEVTVGVLALAAAALAVRGHMSVGEALEVRRLEEKYESGSGSRESSRGDVDEAEEASRGGGPGPGDDARASARGSGRPRSG